MIDRVRRLPQSRQVQPLKSLQHSLTGRPSRRTLGIAREESGQPILLLSQLLAHLVFEQTENAQPQREQAQQALHPVLTAQLQWRDRQRTAFQAPEAALAQRFLAVGQYR